MSGLISVKSNTKISRILFFIALCIVSVTLWYTNSLANKLKLEEQKKVALWAKATKELSEISPSNYNIGFVFEVVNNNTTVPVIQVNEQGEIIAHRNIKGPQTDLELLKHVTFMKNKYPPIEVELIDGSKEYIYYKDSRLLQNLKNFPIIILSIIGAFIFIAYIAFSNAKIAEQNKVWTGMAKETAHQIGTPLSSLLGWVEILKSKKSDKQTVLEIENDLERLSVIASRFSKIGSLPKLKKLNLVSLITDSVDYMQKRASSKYHSGGLWTNTCCSHPRDGEDIIDAANRRLNEEMGIKTSLRKVFDFIYTAELDNNLIENEFDHVFYGVYDIDPIINKDEAEDFKWVDMETLKNDIENNKDQYTVWFKIAFDYFYNYLKK